MVEVGVDQPYQIRCVPVDTDIEIVKGIEDPLASKKEQREWKPFFNPNKFIENNPDPQLDEYRLNE